MKKTIFGVTAFVLVLAATIFVVGQRGGQRDGMGPGFGRGPGHGPGMGMMFRGLDLTDEQKAKVKEITDASRANIEPIMQQLRDNRQKLAALGTNGTFDQAQVESAAAAQGSLMARMIVEREKTKAQVFAILTDAQKAKAAEMHNKMQERFKDGKGRGPMHGFDME